MSRRVCTEESRSEYGCNCTASTIAPEEQPKYCPYRAKSAEHSHHHDYRSGKIQHGPLNDTPTSEHHLQVI
ncbi:hypothetical protein GDO78_014376 [Eleutherodactylus coqui]|uniref:Uncharacterized protein n=1 Tax=Eleutherodactylus coqui TaxID=57060 RepID=A0A8J6EEX8_ELECQ|nr:hypothetical protein GDO78_014376 [Eleutherodactylus coqui]